MKLLLWSMLSILILAAIAGGTWYAVEELTGKSPPELDQTYETSEELGDLPYSTLSQYTWIGISPSGEAGRLDQMLDELAYQTNWSSLYKEGEFDCSEMSAFLENALEQNGFDTYILVAEMTERDWTGNLYGLFYEGKAYHAWIAVRFGSEYVAVESTGPYTSSFYGSYKYQMIFDDYASAEAKLPGEFDYWNSPQPSQIRYR